MKQGLKSIGASFWIDLDRIRSDQKSATDNAAECYHVPPVRARLLAAMVAVHLNPSSCNNNLNSQSRAATTPPGSARKQHIHCSCSALDSGSASGKTRLHRRTNVQKDGLGSGFHCAAPSARLCWSTFHRAVGTHDRTISIFFADTRRPTLAHQPTTLTLAPRGSLAVSKKPKVLSPLRRGLLWTADFQ